MLSLTIRPVSGECNARCEYCYMEEVRLGKNGKTLNIMNIETLEEIIKKYQKNEKHCQYIWHGGEPTLAGIAFYKKVISLQNKYFNDNIISNSMQTNAWKIDDDWITFIKETGINIGISLDGPKHINDPLRGKGYFDKTMKAVKKLQSNEIPFSVICVISAGNVSYPKEIFEFFYTNNFKKVSFNPIFGEHSKLDLNNPLDFADFLNVIFDKWIEKDDEDFEIRFLKESIMTMLGGNTTLCMMMGGCNNHIVIERNGDILPCHSYDMEYNKIGNIFDMSLQEASFQINESFSDLKSFVTTNCSSCRWYPLCGGDCIRFIESDGLNFKKTHFCESRQKVFEHMENKLVEAGMMENRFGMELNFL